MSAHEYGIESDCICGRNFTTVRGLREHLTKARRKCAECGKGQEPTAPTPRWDADPVAQAEGWLDGRCGNCGSLNNRTVVEG